MTADELRNNMALEVTVENSPAGDPSPADVDNSAEGLLAISNISRSDLRYLIYLQVRPQVSHPSPGQTSGIAPISRSDLRYLKYL